jgi:L-ascorbate metabolism protein UlaG (beta-lactamase superfamily)
MKITKFAQSCVLIETKGKKILIDPGIIGFNESILKKWKSIDLLLVTHKHTDHCNVDAIKEIIRDDKIKFYTSKEVADTFKELSPNIIKEKDIIKLEDIKIEVVKAIHGYIPWLKGEKEVEENIGFIINGDKKVYFTSDTISFKNDYKCDILIVPITNHGIVMGPFEAALFAKETKAELVIPVHYDNPKYQIDLDNVKKEFEKQEIKYKFLEIKESININ